MKLIPEDPLQILKKGLNSRNSYIALEALCKFPQYAQDSEIKQGIINCLSDSIPRHRRDAAYILHKIGHPLGIDHLVYGGLTVHPEFGYIHTQWDVQINSRIDLIRVAAHLQDIHIGLLMEDTRQPDGNLHIDILAALPKERIVDRIRPWLAGTERERIHAAYVLAIKGDREGGSVLKKLLQDGRHIEFAFVGLSHIPDDESISLFRDYLNPQFPIYLNPVVPDFAGLLFPRVKRILDFRLPLSENPSEEMLLDYFRRYYISSGNVYPLVPAGLLRSNAEVLHLPSSATLIAELASLKVRQKLVELQRIIIDKILETDQKPDWRFLNMPPDDSNLTKLGMKIIVGQDDYVNAVIDRIMHAEKYRRELVGRSISYYMRENMY